MRAAIARRGEIVVDDLPTPEPGPGEVLVRTRACGICGSDLHALHHGRRLAPLMRKAGSFFTADPDLDLVPGHEFCAEVVDYGPGTTGQIPVGSLVCSEPALFTPAGLEPIGFSNDVPGGYGQYMKLMEGLLVPVPNGLPAEHAALTEPMAVGVHAVAKAGLPPGAAVLVVGCGPVGLAVIGALKLAGAEQIIAADFSPKRRSLAEAMGADAVVDPAVMSPYERFQDLAQVDPARAAPRPIWRGGPSLRPQVIFECVGVPGVLASVLEGAEPGARVVVVGVCMEQDHFEPIYAINKEIEVRFVFGHSPDEFAATLRHIAEGDLPVEDLITAKVGLDGVAGAFEALADPEEHAKILIDPWADDNADDSEESS